MSIKNAFVIKEGLADEVGGSDMSVSEWAELSQILQPIYYLIKREYPESAHLITKLIRHAKSQSGRGI